VQLESEAFKYLVANAKLVLLTFSCVLFFQCHVQPFTAHLAASHVPLGEFSANVNIVPVKPENKQDEIPLTVDGGNRLTVFTEMECGQENLALEANRDNVSEELAACNSVEAALKDNENHSVAASSLVKTSVYPAAPDSDLTDTSGSRVIGGRGSEPSLISAVPCELPEGSVLCITMEACESVSGEMSSDVAVGLKKPGELTTNKCDMKSNELLDVAVDNLPVDSRNEKSVARYQNMVLEENRQNCNLDVVSCVVQPPCLIQPMRNVSTTGLSQDRDHACLELVMASSDPSLTEELAAESDDDNSKNETLTDMQNIGYDTRSLGRKDQNKPFTTSELDDTSNTFCELDHSSFMTELDVSVEPVTYMCNVTKEVSGKDSTSLKYFSCGSGSVGVKNDEHAAEHHTRDDECLGYPICKQTDCPVKECEVGVCCCEGESSDMMIQDAHMHGKELSPYSLAEVNCSGDAATGNRQISENNTPGKTDDNDAVRRTGAGSSMARSACTNVSLLVPLECNCSDLPESCDCKTERGNAKVNSAKEMKMTDSDTPALTELDEMTDQISAGPIHDTNVSLLVAESDGVILPSSEPCDVVKENRCSETMKINDVASTKITTVEILSDTCVKGIASAEISVGNNGLCVHERNDRNQCNTFNVTGDTVTGPLIYSDDTAVLAEMTDMAEIERVVTTVEERAPNGQSVYSDYNIIRPNTPKEGAANDNSACIDVRSSHVETLSIEERMDCATVVETVMKNELSICLDENADSIEKTKDPLGNVNSNLAKKIDIAAANNNAAGMEGITVIVTALPLNEVHVYNSETSGSAENADVMGIVDSDSTAEEFVAYRTSYCSDNNCNEADVADCIDVVNSAAEAEDTAVIVTEGTADKTPVCNVENIGVEKPDTGRTEDIITTVKAVTRKESTTDDEKHSEIERNDVGDTQIVAVNIIRVNYEESQQCETIYVGVSGKSAEEEPFVDDKNGSQDNVVDITEIENGPTGLKAFAAIVTEVVDKQVPVCNEENNQTEIVATFKAAAGKGYSDNGEVHGQTEESHAGSMQEVVANNLSVCIDGIGGLDTEAYVTGTVGRTFPEELAASDRSVCIDENSCRVESFDVGDTEDIVVNEPLVDNEIGCQIDMSVTAVIQSNAAPTVAMTVTEDAVIDSAVCINENIIPVLEDDSEGIEGSTVEEVVMKELSVNNEKISPGGKAVIIGVQESEEHEISVSNNESISTIETISVGDAEIAANEPSVSDDNVNPDDMADTRNTLNSAVRIKGNATMVTQVIEKKLSVSNEEYISVREVYTEGTIAKMTDVAEESSADVRKYWRVNKDVRAEQEATASETRVNSDEDRQVEMADEQVEPSFISGNYIQVDMADAVGIANSAIGMEGDAVIVTKAVANDIPANSESTCQVEDDDVAEIMGGRNALAKRKEHEDDLGHNESDGKVHRTDTMGTEFGADKVEDIAVNVTEIAENEIPVHNNENEQIETSDIGDTEEVALNERTVGNDNSSQVDVADIGCIENSAVGMQGVAVNVTEMATDELSISSDESSVKVQDDDVAESMGDRTTPEECKEEEETNVCDNESDDGQAEKADATGTEFGADKVEDIAVNVIELVENEIPVHNDENEQIETSDIGDTEEVALNERTVGNDNSSQVDVADIGCIENSAVGMQGVAVNVTEMATDELSISSDESSVKVEDDDVAESMGDRTTPEECKEEEETNVCDSESDDGQAETADATGTEFGADKVEDIAVNVIELAENEIPVRNKENEQIETSDIGDTEKGAVNESTAGNENGSQVVDTEVTTIENYTIGMENSTTSVTNVATNEMCICIDENRRIEEAEVRGVICMVKAVVGEEPPTNGETNSRIAQVEVEDEEVGANERSVCGDELIRVDTTDVEEATTDEPSVSNENSSQADILGTENSGIVVECTAVTLTEDPANELSIIYEENHGAVNKADIIAVVSGNILEELAGSEVDVCDAESGRQVDISGIAGIEVGAMGMGCISMTVTEVTSDKMAVYYSQPCSVVQSIDAVPAEEVEMIESSMSDENGSLVSMTDVGFIENSAVGSQGVAMSVTEMATDELSISGDESSVKVEDDDVTETMGDRTTPEECKEEEETNVCDNESDDGQAEKADATGIEFGADKVEDIAVNVIELVENEIPVHNNENEQIETSDIGDTEKGAVNESTAGNENGSQVVDTEVTTIENYTIGMENSTTSVTNVATNEMCIYIDENRRIEEADSAEVRGVICMVKAVVGEEPPTNGETNSRIAQVEVEDEEVGANERSVCGDELIRVDTTDVEEATTDEPSVSNENSSQADILGTENSGIVVECTAVTLTEVGANEIPICSNERSSALETTDVMYVEEVAVIESSVNEINSSQVDLADISCTENIAVGVTGTEVATNEIPFSYNANHGEVDGLNVIGFGIDGNTREEFEVSKDSVCIAGKGSQTVSTHVAVNDVGAAVIECIAMTVTEVTSNVMPVYNKEHTCGIKTTDAGGVQEEIAGMEPSFINGNKVQVDVTDATGIEMSVIGMELEGIADNISEVVANEMPANSESSCQVEDNGGIETDCSGPTLEACKAEVIACDNENDGLAQKCDTAGTELGADDMADTAANVTEFAENEIAIHNENSSQVHLTDVGCIENSAVGMQGVAVNVTEMATDELSISSDESSVKVQDDDVAESMGGRTTPEECKEEEETNVCDNESDDGQAEKADATGTEFGADKVEDIAVNVIELVENEIPVHNDENEQIETSDIGDTEKGALNERTVGNDNSSQVDVADIGCIENSAVGMQGVAVNVTEMATDELSISSDESSVKVEDDDVAETIGNRTTPEECKEGEETNVCDNESDDGQAEKADATGTEFGADKVEDIAVNVIELVENEIPVHNDENEQIETSDIGDTEKGAVNESTAGNENGSQVVDTEVTTIENYTIGMENSTTSVTNVATNEMCICIDENRRIEEADSAEVRGVICMVKAVVGEEPPTNGETNGRIAQVEVEDEEVGANERSVCGDELSRVDTTDVEEATTDEPSVSNENSSQADILGTENSGIVVECTAVTLTEVGANEIPICSNERSSALETTDVMYLEEVAVIESSVIEINSSQVDLADIPCTENSAVGVTGTEVATYEIPFSYNANHGKVDGLNVIDQQPCSLGEVKGAACNVAETEQGTNISETACEKPIESFSRESGWMTKAGTLLNAKADVLNPKWTAMVDGLSKHSDSENMPLDPASVNTQNSATLEDGQFDDVDSDEETCFLTSSKKIAYNPIKQSPKADMHMSSVHNESPGSSARLDVQSDHLHVPAAYSARNTALSSPGRCNNHCGTCDASNNLCCFNSCSPVTAHSVIVEHHSSGQDTNINVACNALLPSSHSPESRKRKCSLADSGEEVKRAYRQQVATMDLQPVSSYNQNVLVVCSDSLGHSSSASVAEELRGSNVRLSNSPNSSTTISTSNIDDQSRLHVVENPDVLRALYASTERPMTIQTGMLDSPSTEFRLIRYGVDQSKTVDVTSETETMPTNVLQHAISAPTDGSSFSNDTTFCAGDQGFALNYIKMSAGVFDSDRQHLVPEERFVTSSCLSLPLHRDKTLCDSTGLHDVSLDVVSGNIQSAESAEFMMNDEVSATNQMVCVGTTSPDALSSCFVTAELPVGVLHNDVSSNHQCKQSNETNELNYVGFVSSGLTAEIVNTDHALVCKSDISDSMWANPVKTDNALVAANDMEIINEPMTICISSLLNTTVDASTSLIETSDELAKVSSSHSRQQGLHEIGRDKEGLTSAVSECAELTYIPVESTASCLEISSNDHCLVDHGVSFTVDKVSMASNGRKCEEGAYENEHDISNTQDDLFAEPSDALESLSTFSGGRLPCASESVTPSVEGENDIHLHEKFTDMTSQLTEKESESYHLYLELSQEQSKCSNTLKRRAWELSSRDGPPDWNQNICLSGMETAINAGGEALVTDERSGEFPGTQVTLDGIANTEHSLHGSLSRETCSLHSVCSRNSSDQSPASQDTNVFSSPHSQRDGDCCSFDTTECATSADSCAGNCSEADDDAMQYMKCCDNAALTGDAESVVDNEGCCVHDGSSDELIESAGSDDELIEHSYSVMNHKLKEPAGEMKVVNMGNFTTKERSTSLAASTDGVPSKGTINLLSPGVEAESPSCFNQQPLPRQQPDFKYGHCEIGLTAAESQHELLFFDVNAAGGQLLILQLSCMLVKDAYDIGMIRNKLFC
jgi:hypothetical protein